MTRRVRWPSSVLVEGSEVKGKFNLRCDSSGPVSFSFKIHSAPFSQLFPPLHQSLTAESLRRASHLVCVLSPGPWVKYKRTRETQWTFIFHVRNCFSSPHQRQWVESQRTQEASQAARRTLGFWNRGDSISISFSPPSAPKVYLQISAKLFKTLTVCH